MGQSNEGAANQAHFAGCGTLYECSSPAGNPQGASSPTSENGTGDGRKPVVLAEDHFNIFQRMWDGSLQDYDVGYTDLEQSLSVAESKVIAMRKWYDSNSSGHANAASQAGHTIGIYVYSRDGYYWVGKNVHSSIGAGGCAACGGFSGGDPSAMPSHVHRLTAVLSSPSMQPNNSFWSKLGKQLPGGATVFIPGDPYIRREFP